MNEKIYELVELQGKYALFSDLRIKLPEQFQHLHTYGIRHEDERSYRACQLQKSVIANHYGSIMSDIEFDLKDGYCLYFEDEELIFHNQFMTVSEYLDAKLNIDQVQVIRMNGY